MTKIQPISSKPRSPPPRDIQEKIELFATCPLADLAGHLATFTRWDHPTGDLRQWIVPLNRFDEILFKAVVTHGDNATVKIQTKPFSPEDKELICQILRVTVLLFGNCAYRNIYGSAPADLKAVFKLLWTTDLDVLENVLRLVACFAARNADRPESSNKSLVVNKQSLWKFVTGEAIDSKQPPFPDMKSLLSTQVVIPSNWAGYYFHYYRRAPPTSAVAAPSGGPTIIPTRFLTSPVTPTPKAREAVTDHTQRSSVEATTPEAKSTTEGWVRVHLKHESVNILKHGIHSPFRYLVSQANIPKEDHGRLFIQFLQAYYYNEPARREQFLRCQLHALLSLGSSAHPKAPLTEGNICDSKDLEKHVYNSRPDIIPQMVRLLHNDSEAGLPLKTLVLRVLRTLSRNSLCVSNRRSEHSRFQQILTALDSNLNHGILMTLLRENVAFLQNNDPTVDEMNYSQALHRLVREFLESPMGASNLGFAGLVPLLVEFLKIKRASVWNMAVTTADLLASLIRHHRENQILPLFIEADGPNTVIHVIRQHVDLNLAKSAPEEGPHHSLLTFPEHQLLLTFLTLLNRLVKSGHGERVRAVVDSPVIPSIREIFNNLPLFGGYIAWQAAKLLSLILHNEPTSYPALHENGLPQAFLNMIDSGIRPVPDFIQSLPTVFDAICINAQGKELFAQYHFRGLFAIFKSLEHCRALVKDHAIQCGVGVDELLRHHPDLKDPFLRGFKEFLEEASEIILREEAEGPKLPEMMDVKGAEVADAEWRSSMRPGLYLTMARTEEERNLPTLQRIRAIVDFTDGLFRRGFWIKDVIKDDGPIRFMSWLNAPALPYDFPELREGYSLRSLMVTFSEMSTGGQVTQPLIKATKDIVDEIISNGLLLPTTDVVDPKNSDFDADELNRLLKLYSRLHLHLAVLQSVYTPQPNMQGRVQIPFTGNFGVQENVDMLRSLGTIIRDLYWRATKLLRSVPKKYRDALQLDTFDTNGRKRTDKPEMTDEEFLKKYGFPQREPGFRNAAMIQYLASFLSRKILRFFAGLSNSIVIRNKMSDPPQRAVAVTVVNVIGEVFLALLGYEEIKREQTNDAYLYLFCCANFISTVLNGGNDHGPTSQDKMLQTFLLYQFHTQGGLKVILNIIKSLAESLRTLDKDKPSDHECLVAVTANLKKFFSLVCVFITESYINEAPQTTALSNRERHRDQGHYFNLASFLTDTRATCIPVFCELMAHLEDFDKGTAQPFLTILSELILGGPEEYNGDGMKYDEPDEGTISRIAAQGFDRPLVYSALMSHANAENVALQHLLSRRGAVPPSDDNLPTAPPLPPSTSALQVALAPPVLSLDSMADESNLLELVYDMNSRMDIDESDIGPPAPPPTTEKGKDKAEPTTPDGPKDVLTETRTETLARLRAEFSRNLENYVTDILIYHPDLPFQLSRMITSVGKWESHEWIQEKMLELSARLASMEDDKSSKAREITACAHVLGLLLNEKRYYEAAEGSIIAFLDSFVEFLNVGVNGEAPWMASISLIIEIVIREIEWRQTKKRLDPAFANVDVPDLEPDFFPQLMDKLVAIIKADGVDETVILCVMRLLVRLTRETQYATLFREKEGLQALLHLNHRLAGKPTVKISDPSVIIIRNLVEDEKIILATMRSAIQAVLDVSAQRGRHVELGELLRSKYSEVLRNPELFSDAVESIGKLANWSSTNPTSHKLVKKQMEETPVESADGSRSADAEATDTKAAVTPETPKKPTLELSHSSGVVQIIVSELLSHQSEAISSPKKEPKESASSDPAPDSAAPNGADTPRSTKQAEMTPEELKEYCYTLFLLQILAELVGSYNNCKLEFVNYSRRGQSREPMTPSKPRSMMLNYLLNDLLQTGQPHYNATITQELALEKKRGISALVVLIISSLCKKTPENYENDDRPDLLLNVRKFVLEGIMRSLKDTLALSGTVEQRYSRYTSLAELCRKLLQSQSPLVHPNMAFDVAGSSAMAKLMYEKGFVGLLASIVADIELDFPDVKVVINDILPCLKDLATSLNRLVQNGSLDTGNVSGDIEEISTASSASEDGQEEEMQERDDTPDVFRHSALGIMQGVVEDAGPRNHHRHDFNEYDEEMDYDDDDDDDDDDDVDDDDNDEDQSGSEDDDMDDDGVDDDLDVRAAVEIIMEEGGVDDDDEDDDEVISERSSDLSGDEDDMDEEDHDGVDDEGSHEDSIVGILEEQQMEEQVDRDGWTTDTDSVEEEEEMDDEDANDELIEFPPVQFHTNVGDGDDNDGGDYSEEDLDDAAIEHFREMVGNIRGQFFSDGEEDDDDDDDDDHNHRHDHSHFHGSFFSIHGRQSIRQGGPIALRTGIFQDDLRAIQSRNMAPPPPANAGIHPMMVSAAQAPPRDRTIRNGNRLSQLAQSVPPDLFRSMEQFFSMQNALNDLMTQLGDGAQTTISLEVRPGISLPPSMRRRILPLLAPGRYQPVPTEGEHPFKIANEYVGLETSTRWQQAVNMWLTSPSAAADRSAIYEAPIFKRLEPAALEEERLRRIKEEEKQKALEKERQRLAEEERRKAQEEAEARERAEVEARVREEAERLRQEEARQQRLAQEQAERERLAAEALIESSNGPGIIAMEGVETESAPDESEQTGESGENAASAEPEAEAPTERIYTVLRGNRVDITGLGVDPEFLEALPEEMREEVLYQHIRERRAAAPPDQPSTLDPSFLDALPEDIRAELLEEEAEERRRQERIAQRRAAGVPPAAGDMDNANFLASLDPPLRQAILLEQDEDFISQLPPHIAAEANALRERVGHRVPYITRRAPAQIFGEMRRKQPSPKRKDGIQMLEKSGLATLIRLTFLRNRPEALQDILIELCRHRQTRIEVVALLLSLLQEGSADVAAVERSFSQLSLKVKGQDIGQTPMKAKTKMDSNLISLISGENSPTLIARHCLEILNHLVKNNTSLPYYFLTEHDAPPALKRVNSKKGKGKEVVTKESRYPLNALLSLLERSAILDTKQSTEEFARLLADVTKPLLSLLRKPKREEKSKEAKEGQAADAPEATSGLEEPPAAATVAATVEPAAPTDDEVPENPEAGASTSAPPKPGSPQQTRSLIPPVISEHNLELLVLILVAKEVSRETFRSTLATMHHLMAVPGALEVFGRGLSREAQRYGDLAQSDLWAIAQKFEAAKEAGNLKDVDLTEYTSRGADQTKLLKIFKAIDYLFNRAQRDTTVIKDKDDSEPSLDALTIYSQLSLNPLWDNLSMCLGYLGDNPETWPLAQPLLPMIESLLVACNHINTTGPGKRPQTPEAEQIESLFYRFTEEHRKILNYLVHMQPSLMSGSFEMLAHNPKVLEFDNKRNYFNRKLHDRKGQRIHTRSIPLNIRRDMVFLDSFRSLCFRTGEEIKNARLNVRFQGEEGVDAGGLTREWYQVLARQMFDPNYALFTPVASDSATFHPNKSSYVNDEHLMFFKFVGRIIGKALYDGRLLDCHFSRAVYKHILGRPISVKDLEYYDNQYHKNLMWILENPINDIVTETFSIEAEEYGVTHIIDLVPDGRTIQVTDENKTEYVRLVSEYRLQTSVKDQLKEFLAGFHDIIAADLISIFTEQELELLISGLPDIDIEDWKAHSTYQNYDATSPQIQWFWRAVRSFNKEERAKLLQFATGTSKVPLNGFKELEGMQGTTKFTIVRDFGHKTRLPQSHTCFNQIDLPEYDSYEQLRSSLLTAITMGTEGFGFA